MKAADIRQKFISFYVSRGHVEIPSAPIVPVNDPTTLFTSSGMQPLVPYLLGQKHPTGNRLVDSQKSFRSQDIDEVGDNRHTTFFEMLGNWSLGDYFKKEQLPWIFTFLTRELGLDPKRLYVSVFEGMPESGGEASVPKDNESIEIWRQLFREAGIEAKVGERIFTYPAKKNWWSRSGEPEKMPPGEPGGPDSEVFFDFGPELGLHEHSPWKDEVCHPNCDCGRFMEIANSVFMQYKKQEDGSLVELSQKNVDFGGGLERMAAAVNNDPDVFRTDLFLQIISVIESHVGAKYGSDDRTTKAMRIVADHLKAATFMITEGLFPGNKQQGYVLRRLIRRAVVKMHLLGMAAGKAAELGNGVFAAVGDIYKGVYFDTASAEFAEKRAVLEEEMHRFEKVLRKGMGELEKHTEITGKVAFDLLQSFGFPWELTYEIALEKGQHPDRDEFAAEFKKHQDLSRTAAAGMFKGGLADHSVATTRLHTAHHLLLATLQKNIDSSIRQRGSNITAERLRIDVSFTRKFTKEELALVEAMVNEQIAKNLAVKRVEMPKTVAETIGAQMEFGAKYPDRVSVYFVGLRDGVTPESATAGDYVSAEFCGGPHVAFTGELGHFTIIKEDASGAGVRRLYATVS